MKKSDAIKLIKDTFLNVNDEMGMLSNEAEAILNALLEAGMLPPKHDYIEHYAWKSDHTWEKE